MCMFRLPNNCSLLGWCTNTQNIWEERKKIKGTHEPPIKSEDSITADHQLPLLLKLLPLKENIQKNFNNMQLNSTRFYTQGHSLVMQFASLLRIISRVISACVLKNGGFFFTVGPRLLWGFIWYKRGAVAPKRTWGPLIFISKFKFI